MAQLEIIKLSSGYDDVLINELSLSTSQPGTFCILGKNGSGKTTLLKCIAQQQPYKGFIKWGGIDLKSISVSERAKNISYLHQKNSISINLKVSELVVMGRYRFKSVFGNYNSEDYKKVDFWLERLGVLKYRNSFFQELSGGEQQLVWICQSFIQETPIIVLDEPTSQLDLENKRKVFDLISERSKKDKLVILVTHDIEYLKNSKGCFINLSSDDHSLKEITEDELAVQREILEEPKLSK